MRTLLHALARALTKGQHPIVMVHGVFDEDPAARDRWNPVGKHLSINQLDSFLSEVCKKYQPISLHELLNCFDQQRSPRFPCFALTFDDGYAGFEELILPILEKHQCPATFFPVVDFLDGQWLWTDYVERALLEQNQWPNPAGEMTPARQVLTQWKNHLKFKPTKQRQALIEERLPQPQDRPFYTQAVSWEELRKLGKHPLVDIGNHTLSHPSLPHEQPDTIIHEIRAAAERLRKEVGECSLFCYPNGSVDDHNAVTSQVIQDSGHRCALLTTEALVDHKTSRWHLPRFSLSANTVATNWLYNGLSGVRDLRQKISL